jgi:hypothetical protein
MFLTKFAQDLKNLVKDEGGSTAALVRRAGRTRVKKKRGRQLMTCAVCREPHRHKTMLNKTSQCRCTLAFAFVNALCPLDRDGA